MSGSISRRNFVRIAMGSFVVLPSVVGGFLIPRREALAESGGETNAGGADDATTKITLVFASEVGFYVADVSKVETVPIRGARVKVTSRYNDKSVEGTTRADGVVKLDIRHLAENPDNENVDRLDEYAFNGTVTMYCDGYREFEMPLTRIEGGQGLLVPTRTLTDGLPYPRTVSFNEWDALYTENEFLESPANGSNHVLSMEWKQMPSNSAATVRLCDRDTGEVLQSKTVRPSGGTLKASFEKPFLKSDGADSLPLDTNLDVEVTQGGTTYLAPINLVAREGVTEDAKEAEEFKMEPLSYGMDALGVDWPLDVPILGGGAVKSFAPDCYVNVSWNPWGYVQFTLKTPSWGYYNDTGNDPSVKKGWGTYPRASALQQYDKMMQKASKNVQSTQAAYQSPYGIAKINTFASIKMQGNIQILALAKWSEAKRLMQGNAALQLFIGCSANYTCNYFVGPFPVLVTFGIDASLVFSVSCGFYSLQLDNSRDILGALFDFGSWKWDYANTGFTITFNFTPSLSVGLGVTGVASVSVKGAVTISFVTAFDVPGKGNNPSKPRPHVVTGYAVVLTLVIHAFLCTATFKLKEKPFKAFYDNWKNLKTSGDDGLSTQSHGDRLRAMAETDVTEPLKKMQLITSKMLKSSIEFDLDTQSELETQSERVAFNWETMREDDVVSVLDNGKTIRYKVISLRTNEIEGDEDLVLQSEEERLAPEAEGVSEEKTGQDTDGIVLGEETVVEEGPEGEREGADEAVASGAAVSPKSGGRVRRRRNMRSLNYVPRNRHLLRTQAYDPTTNTSLPTPEPLELGSRGGIRPASDMKINEDGEYVYGDPRFKVVDLRTYAGTTRIHATCVFRIGIVSVGGKPRSRLIMTILNAGVESAATGKVNIDDYIGISKVIDFDIDDVYDEEGDLIFEPEVDRADLFDYDFDVALTSENDNDIVRITLVSGIRESGDETPVYNLITDIFYTYLSFEANDVFSRFDYDHKITMPAAASYLTDDEMYHSVSNVRCATDGTQESPTLLVAYLDRVSSDPRQLLMENSEDVVTKVGFVLIDCVGDRMLFPNRDEVDDAIAPLHEPCIYGLELLPQTTVYDADDEEKSLGKAYTLMLTSLMKETYLYIMRLGFDEDDNPVVTSAKQAPTLETSTHLVWWPNHDSFLTSFPTEEYLAEINENGLWKNPLEWDRSKWVLQKCWWVEEHDSPYDETLTTPVLRFKQIGPDGFSFSNFGVNSAGTFIFWPQTRDEDKDGEYGSRRVYQDDGTFTNEPEEALHNLMACRIKYEKFSDPFIVADVDHEMNTLQVVRTNDRYAPLEVLSSEFEDLGERDEDGNEVYHAANIWYTAIPNLRCATATGCTSPLPLVAPGGTITFHVTVRNDGNCYLAGCTLQMCVHENRVTDENGEVILEDVFEVMNSFEKITFSEKTLLESCWNPVEDGEMQNIEDDYSLAPGKRGVYKVVVKIPEDWGEDGEDEKWVSFVAREPEMAEGGGLVAMSEDDPVFQEFSVAPGTFKPYEHQMTPRTDRNQTHMQVIEITDAEADGTVVSDTPVTYATGGERPEPARPADQTRPSDGTSSATSDSGDAPGTHVHPNGSYDPSRTRRGDQYLWPIGSGTRFTYPTYDGVPGRPDGSGSGTSGTAQAPATSAIATPARPSTPAPAAPVTSVTPGAGTGATSATAGSTATATPVTGGASSTPATSSTRGGSVTPTTADGTDVGLVAAAALAGVAVASAGMALKDEEKTD